MTDADIKKAIKTIEVHHEHGWWVADMPDIGVTTQAKTLPDLGAEIERIIGAHFEACAEHGTDPFRCKRLSLIDEVTKTLNVVLETRTSTYASVAAALRMIEDRLRVVAVAPIGNADVIQWIREEVLASTAAVAAVAALIETPLTTKVQGT